jgi:hypothetical protein
MNINTCEALLAELQIMQFKFESLNGQNKENNIANIVSTLKKCDIVTPKKEKWYRARKIQNNDENIIYNEVGIPIRGYDSEQSGVAPARYISEGRANDKNEQVLYVAEDQNTALKEIKTVKDSYISLSYCVLNKNIRLLDFSPYSNNELEGYANNQFNAGTDKMIFVEMQRILTLPEYSENEYVISRKLVRLIKENIKASGMLYISHYTGKKNIAIWDNNKFITFSEGKVVQGI